MFYESAAYAEMVDDTGFIKSFDSDVNTATATRDASKKGIGSESKGEYRAESRIGQDPNVQNSSVQPILPVGNLAGLHKFEIPLSNGGVAYIFAPARLPLGEKERLKKFIDLMLDEPPVDAYKDDDGLNNEFVSDTMPNPNL